MRAPSMRPPPFARRSTMGTTDRSKKRSRRCAARPRSDEITTRLSCSFNFLAIRGRAQGVIADVAIGCDIVVENFRPGILKRLGLSYDDIAAEKPGIIWCCISGFGQEGPYRDRPAYDMIVQAMS